MTPSEIKDWQMVKQHSLANFRAACKQLRENGCYCRANSDMTGTHHAQGCPMRDVVAPKETIDAEET
jgi:hypothetical protein